MAIDVQYDQRRGFLKITVTGEIVPEELNAVFSSIRESKEYPVNIEALWDLRQADFETVDEALLKRIIAIRSRYQDRSDMKAAFITSDELSYGVSRMYEVLSGFEIKRNIRIFMSYAEGERWLLENRSP